MIKPYGNFSRPSRLHLFRVDAGASDGDVLSFSFRLWDRATGELLKTLSFEASVGSMEYVPDGEILVITYGRTIAFYNAHS